MIQNLTSAQMRGIERLAIESGANTGLTLMERAGEATVEAILAAWPRFATASTAVILCGPGNNGGDGFVIARLLKARGWDVSVVFYGDADRLPADAHTNFERWLAVGPVQELNDAEVMGALAVKAPDLIVDALFGTGLTRDLPTVVTQALHNIAQWMHSQDAPPRIVAVDIPSGLCADSGRDRSAGLRADLTVTFHRAKLGHFLADGPEWCGVLRVVDIGLPQDSVPDVGFVQQIGPDAARWLHKSSGHKFDHGHALILSGGVGQGGAARMAARAALRVGAGVVTLGVPASALQENACRLDAIMLRRVGDADALTDALTDARITALCLGPGLGLHRAQGLVTAALTATDPGRTVNGSAALVRRAVVVDADALSGFADDPAALWPMLHPRCVLTPHLGEFRRLFPDIAADLARRPTQGAPLAKTDAVRAAAKRAGCVVLLKGADTVIADPAGRCALHAASYDRAAPWLATAGAGDVLAGIITGLLARGVPAFEAAGIGAWLHVEAALSFGPGLIAEDLPDLIPNVLRGLVEQPGVHPWGAGPGAGDL